MHFLQWIYVCYWAWFLLLGTEACDYGNTSNNDGWKQIGSGMRSESLISISPGFRKLELFLLELVSLGYGPNRSQSRYTIWGNDLRAETEEWDDSSQAA